MDKLIRRVTVVRADGGKRNSTVVYTKRDANRRGRRKTTPMLRPIERAMESALKAVAVGGQTAHDRYIKSASKRRNGWLTEAPANVIKVSRKAYNEARKGVPFRVLPRLD